VRRGYLVLEEDGRRVEVPERMVVGRTSECDLVVDDNAASRRHIEITLEPLGFQWRDLKSSNGTLINGMRMLGGVLKNGDVIQIGDTRMKFEQEEVATANLKRPASRIFSETVLDSSGHAKRPEVNRTASDLLEAVYSVTNEMVSSFDPAQLVDRLLDMTLKAINAQRGAILLADKDGNLLEDSPLNRAFEYAANGFQKADPKQIRISSTVARRVLQQGESVLYQDADDDSELNAAASIVSMSLRSIVCAPLRAKDRILGVLYIDSDRAEHSYTNEDMLVASAVGNSAGLALENARLHKESLDRQRIEQEIETAWTIQEGFLVREWAHDDPRFQVYGETRPAKTVGGDFYDYVRPEADVVGILIGDVSGKGVPAALMMAQMLAEFRIHARDHGSPADVLSQLNRSASKRSSRGLFCTLCYIRLDLRTGEATCANAGHNPPLHITSDGIAAIAEASGPPVGILPDGPWQDETLNIGVGDALLLYTDGIVEARSQVTQLDLSKPEPPQEYELEHLIEFCRTQPDCAPDALIAAVNHDVLKFCAPEHPHDDCTMIALRRVLE